MKIDLGRLTDRTPGISDSEMCTGYSILLPIVRTDDNDALVFEVRSEKLDKQPSEICFPGGRIEKGESHEMAAIRETSEELLLHERNIRIVSELDTVVTPFNKILYPFVGMLNNYEGTYSEGEVKEVFTVPIDYLLKSEPSCTFIDVILKPKDDFPFENVQSGKGYPWGKGKYPVYFYSYEDKIIWGLTAKILHNFLSVLKENM